MSDTRLSEDMGERRRALLAGLFQLRRNLSQGEREEFMAFLSSPAWRSGPGHNSRGLPAHRQKNP